MVAKLVKDPNSIQLNLSLSRIDLVHAVLGIAGEAGELVDAVKKNCIYNKAIDRDNIIEELGDLEFYMEQLRSNLLITRDETLLANIQKLSIRYPNFQYTDAMAQERLDKVV